MKGQVSKREQNRGEERYRVEVSERIRERRE